MKSNETIIRNTTIALMLGALWLSCLLGNFTSARLLNGLDALSETYAYRPALLDLILKVIRYLVWLSLPWTLVGFWMLWRKDLSIWAVVCYCASCAAFITVVWALIGYSIAAVDPCQAMPRSIAVPPQ